MKKCLQEKMPKAPTTADGWVPVQHQVWVRRVKGTTLRQMEYRVDFREGRIIGGTLPLNK